MKGPSRNQYWCQNTSDRRGRDRPEKGLRFQREVREKRGREERSSKYFTRKIKKNYYILTKSRQNPNNLMSYDLTNFCGNIVQGYYGNILSLEEYASPLENNVLCIYLICRSFMVFEQINSRKENKLKFFCILTNYKRDYFYGTAHYNKINK